MKKFLFMALCLFLSIGTYAQSQGVDLTKGGGTVGNGNHGPIHAPALLPTLCYEGTAFTLIAPYDIEDLEIIISDANGNVLYYNKVDVTAGPYVFYVPSAILADMALVELYYGNTYLYGDL